MLKKSFTIGIFLFLYTLAIAQKPLQKQQFMLFWVSNCSNCHTAIPQLVKKIETLDRDKFMMTAVSFDTDSASYYKAIKELNMTNFVHQHNFKAGYMNNQLAKKYHITKTPTLICINKEGNIIAEGNEAFKLLSSFKKKE